MQTFAQLNSSAAPCRSASWPVAAAHTWLRVVQSGAEWCRVAGGVVQADWAKKMRRNKRRIHPACITRLKSIFKANRPPHKNPSKCSMSGLGANHLGSSMDTSTDSSANSSSDE